jgi:hypothetical protein
MKLSNNSLKRHKNIIEKYYSDNERIKREKYFYLKFKNKNLNIPKLLDISKYKISFKKYKFKKVNSQKIFLNALLNFLIKTNKQKNYNLYSKEYLKNYNFLFKQVQKRFKKISKTKVEMKYSLKMRSIKSYIRKTLQQSPPSSKLLKCRKIISQSDLGFHNCGMQNNKVFFYDFEYAGLDHPIKLICDVYYQPEKRINKKYMLQFVNKFEKKFKFKIPKNFSIFEKLLKVKMMLIILNIFMVSNINIKSKKIDKSKLNRLKSERINKVYKYIKMPLLYE